MRKMWLALGIAVALLSHVAIAAAEAAKTADATTCKPNTTGATSAAETARSLTLIDGQVTVPLAAPGAASPVAGGGVSPQSVPTPPRPATPNCPLETCSTNCGSGCDATGTQNDDDTGLTACVLVSGAEFFCTGGKTIHEISNDCVKNCPPPPPIKFCTGRQTTALRCE